MTLLGAGMPPDRATAADPSAGRSPRIPCNSTSATVGARSPPPDVMAGRSVLKDPGAEDAKNLAPGSGDPPVQSSRGRGRARPPHPPLRHGLLLRRGARARRPVARRQAGGGGRRPRGARGGGDGQLRGQTVRHPLGDAGGAGEASVPRDRVPRPRLPRLPPRVGEDLRDLPRDHARCRDRLAGRGVPRRHRPPRPVGDRFGGGEGDPAPRPGGARAHRVGRRRPQLPRGQDRVGQLQAERSQGRPARPRAVVPRPTPGAPAARGGAGDRTRPRGHGRDDDRPAARVPSGRPARALPQPRPHPARVRQRHRRATRGAVPRAQEPRHREHVPPGPDARRGDGRAARRDGPRGGRRPRTARHRSVHGDAQGALPGLHHRHALAHLLGADGQRPQDRFGRQGAAPAHRGRAQRRAPPGGVRVHPGAGRDPPARAVRRR